MAQLDADNWPDRQLGDMAVGLILATSALGLSGQAFLWMLPVIVGMVSCIPLAALTSRRDLGLPGRAAGPADDRGDPPAPVLRAFSALLPAAPATPLHLTIVAVTA
jgi:hypothetical protein